MQRAGRYAQFTNNAPVFIEFQFPGLSVHSKGAGKAYSRAIPAVDALILPEMDALVEWFTYNLVVDEVLYPFFYIFLFPLQFQQQASAFSRVNFCLQDVYADVIIAHQVIAQGLVTALGREVKHISFFNHCQPPFPLNY